VCSSLSWETARPLPDLHFFDKLLCSLVSARIKSNSALGIKWYPAYNLNPVESYTCESSNVYGTGFIFSSLYYWEKSVFLIHLCWNTLFKCVWGSIVIDFFFSKPFKSDAFFLKHVVSLMWAGEYRFLFSLSLFFPSEKLFVLILMN